MGACSHERLSASLLDEVAGLIENSPVPGDNTSPAPRLCLQRLDGGNRVDRIAENDGTMKLPFKDGHESEGVDTGGLAHESGGNGEAEQAMGHGAAEGIALGRRMIDMQGIEVAREAGKEDDISFRYGSSWTFPFVTDDKVIERAD